MLEAIPSSSTIDLWCSQSLFLCIDVNSSILVQSSVPANKNWLLSWSARSPRLICHQWARELIRKIMGNPDKRLYSWVYPFGSRTVETGYPGKVPNLCETWKPCKYVDFTKILEWLCGSNSEHRTLSRNIAIVLSALLNDIALRFSYRSRCLRSYVCMKLVTYHCSSI